MAGAYCRFCDQRCFVYRVIPDGPSKGWGGHLATCAGGMAHDLKVLGHTYLTAVNPVTEQEAVAPVTAVARGGASRVAAAIAAVSPCPYEWTAGDGSDHLCNLLGAPGHQHMCSCGAVEVLALPERTE